MENKAIKVQYAYEKLINNSRVRVVDGKLFFARGFVVYSPLHIDEDDVICSKANASKGILPCIISDQGIVLGDTFVINGTTVGGEFSKHENNMYTVKAETDDGKILIKRVGVPEGIGNWTVNKSMLIYAKKVIVLPDMLSKRHILAITSGKFKPADEVNVITYQEDEVDYVELTVSGKCIVLPNVTWNSLIASALQTNFVPWDATEEDAVKIIASWFEENYNLPTRKIQKDEKTKEIVD